MYEFLENYLLFITFSIFFGTILNDYRLGYTIIYFVFFLFLAYFVHWTIHKTHIPFFTDVHDKHHTAHEKDEIINIILEVFIELFSTGGFLMLLNIPFLTKSLIIYYPLLYSTIHFINYKLDNKHHREHHRDITVNYGPSIIDHLFGTKYNNEYENMNYDVINCLLLFIGLYILKHRNNIW